MDPIAKAGEGQYDFELCDEIADFAWANNASFKFHTLIWAVQGRYPSWIDNLNDSNHLENYMNTYIDTVL